METIRQRSAQAIETVRDENIAPRPHERAGRTLTVSARYHLSEEGRKASLLAGGDGRAVQEMTVQVPTNRFHLVSVDDDGRARLKLQPRFYLDAEQNVVRHDGPPMYDVPPSLDDLLKEAARNHQLERAYHVDRAESRRKRQDAVFESREQLAERFLADPALRAHEHPKPTPRRCYLTHRHRTIAFDAKTDRGMARQVPPEAYRRFSEDLRARQARNHDLRARQLAIHDERERVIAEWVATHGTADQQDRHAARMLPITEVLEGMADDAFAAAGDRPLYVRDGIERLESFLRQFPQYATVVVTRADFQITSVTAEHANASQWALRQELEQLFPDATLTLRLHRLAWARDPKAPMVTQFTVLVTRRVGPFTLRREYLVPDGDE
jgi:hypothetical protein